MKTVTFNDMKNNSLIRLMLVLAVTFVCATAATAQQGLDIDNVFKRFRHANGCKMVEMHDAKLKGFELKVYKSLTHKNLQQEIDPYLATDKKKAKKIREVVENGRVVSGYYIMPQLGGGVNRYILFSNPKENSGALIYIEGELSPDDIMKLCYY